ncbi:MAG TPA: 2Fe-2S iron-sulfur cluster-binding protein, partial [Saprospiraceae bacterium]|nr:2Fe-2S iron-sulfur cluster-binding protein [Saprospiraceae bacterium]
TNNRSYSLFLRLMSRYHPLRIADIRRETAESVSIWLEVPADLKDTFAFKPGQYLNCRAMVNGEELRKSYSICAVPEDPYLGIAVKKVHGGKMSTYINTDLKVGDTFEVTSPEGKFTLPDVLPDDAVLVFFAAGSGITPVISQLRYFLDHYPKGQAVLFYSNRSSDTIIFREQLQAMKNENMNRFSIYHILTKEVTGVDIFSGRVDQEKCSLYGKHFFNPSEIHTAFICGPELMIMDVKSSLQQMGLREDQIRFELFGTGAFYAKREAQEATEFTGEDTMSQVTIRIDGHEVDLKLGYRGQAVLDAGLQSGIDIPFSCKGGVCSTCKAQVVEGKVHMDIHYGLEPDEIDAGIVLTCQSHPRSERLILDYDIL